MISLLPFVSNMTEWMLFPCRLKANIDDTIEIETNA